MSIAELAWYFARLGTLGFGGPVALVGYMHRDLVERDSRISEDDYQMSLALAQLAPGPLAAQVAIAIGYFEQRVLGATVAGLAFVLPSFLMVLALSILYSAYGGLPFMQSAFYGVGAVVIGIIALAAFRLSRSTNRRDPLLWVISGVVFAATVWAQAELAELFVLAGVAVLLIRAPPRALRQLLARSHAVATLAAIPALSTAQQSDLLVSLGLFFLKAGAFVFGSGLAIVPFLYEGAVVEFGWLTEQEFLDSVAVAMLTPGPVVITVAFIGYLVAELPGALVAAIAIFVPVYFFTVIPAPWFARHRDNAQVRAFVQGATAAATGAIAGAVVVLSGRAVVDVASLVLALSTLAILLWRRVPEPILVALGALIGVGVNAAP